MQEAQGPGTVAAHNAPGTLRGRAHQPRAHAAMDAPPDHDESLVRAAARGDRQALGVLYDRHSASLLAVALRMLGSQPEAEDVVHDVFLEAGHRARHYDRTRGSVRTWLMLRLRSRTLDRLRANKRSRASAFDETAPAMRDVAPLAHGTSPEERLDRRLLQDALQTLSSDQLAVLERGYFAGQTCAEMASELHVPIGTVKSRLSRAISQLRSLLAHKESPS
jgi:RNA polymerase sigma-70 factor (ECF subfamily)